jgi:hypothetical protein
MQATRYEEAITMRQKTPDEIEREMDEPMSANFSQYDYHLPNGSRWGIGKSRRPGHAALFQIIVTDFNDKPALKTPSPYAGEYTSQTRAEAALRLFCKEAWQEAERLKSTQTKRSEA